MSNAATETRPAEPVRRGAIVIVDKDPETGQTVLNRVQDQFGEIYEVAKVADEDDALILCKSIQEQRGLEIPVIAVDVALEFDVDPPKLQEFITLIREVVPPTTRVIAYTQKPLEQIHEQAIEAGAFTCVRVEDVEAAIHGVFLDNELGGLELGGLDRTARTAACVVNAIGVNISIQNLQMDVVWANARAALIVDQSDGTHTKCWEKYHKFFNRKCGCRVFNGEPKCIGCTASRVLQDAKERVARGEHVDNRTRTGCHLLPIRRKIERVEVNAAPLIGRDGTVLAVIEATQFVTEEWEKNTLAHDRLHEVIATARALGQDQEQARPFVAVSIYYQPDKDADLHLFDTAADDRSTVAKVLRLAECPAAYRAALEDLEPQFYEDVSTGQRHFLWADRTRSMETFVLIDVVYAGDKPEGLFTDDLRPYWEYVIANFGAARETREKAFDQAANSYLETFLARAANGIRDEAGLDRALKAARECVENALNPLSMHVRILDRKSGTLVQRTGFGPYYQMAPEKRELQFEGIGSSFAASTRREIWNKRAKLDYIRKCVGRDLTPDEEAEVNRIASDVLLPLLCVDRFMGTLCIQFDDDSLFSPAKRRFVKAMANALGNALGTLQWSHERAAVARRSKDLDKAMFRRAERPEEEETGLLAQVTRMVFELTAAEVVTYYRFDAQSRTLTLVSGATQGALPVHMALPEIVPPDVGVVSLAAAEKQGYLVKDYRADDWQGIRRRLISSFPQGPASRFCRWLGSEIAEPVIRGGSVQGVLVALSSIPAWLSPEDAQVVQDFAFKTGLCLEAKDLMRKLNWNQRTKISLNDITARMARTSDLSSLYRLFLLAITADECLGFSRAVLFLRSNGVEPEYVVGEAVGARTQDVAEARWEEAKVLSLEEKMDACARPPQTRRGDLREAISEMVLDLHGDVDVPSSFREGKIAVRRRGASHIVHPGAVRNLLCPQGNQDCEYVLAPLTEGGKVTGVVLADRAFLEDTAIAPDRLDLLQFITAEFALMLEALKLRREEEEATVAKELARGVSYSLKTRAAALEGRLSNFAYAFRGAPQEAIEGLKRAVRFFGRAGTVASKLLHLEQIRVRTGERLDLNTVLAEMVDALGDPRIMLVPSECPVYVQAERHYIEDIFLEIVWNACDITHDETGQITVRACLEGRMARVDCVDNGRGIHPDFRSDLFKPFKFYPASRKGLGLGLSYVAHLVKAYGGTIEENGTWQQGAHFVVRLPLVEGEQNESS